MATHFDWIQRHAERTPDKLAVVDAHTGRTFTYLEWETRIRALARFMRDDLGLERGDRVSILAMNSSDYYEVLFACAKLGVILNTLNWRLAVPELEYILGDCTPKALFYEPDFADAVNALRDGISAEKFVAMGEPASQEDPIYEQVITESRPEPVEGLIPIFLDYDETWAIIYTSGTTGRPKGAQVTYGNFFYNAVGVAQFIGLTSESVNLNVLPTFHIGGLGLYACPTWHMGGTVVVMRAFDPALLTKLIHEYQVSHALLVPSIYLMLQQTDFDPAAFPSMQHWASGGSPLPSSLVEGYAEKGLLIQQGFGMTETGPTVFLIDKEHALAKAGSVGKPVLHTEVCIMDEAENRLGPNEIGELCIRGGNITSGYWNRPEASAEAIRDGWLHSGDAARFDEDGYYYIVDRWKDMFISGGENVYPAEVENLLFKHPAVGEASVIGTPHPKWQEVGRAIVVLKPDQTVTEDELIDFCRGQLAKFKVPKSVVFRTEALPRTAAGKVLKRLLREVYNDRFVGTWTLDPTRSNYQAGNPPAGGSYRIAPHADGYLITMVWETAEGDHREMSYEANPDGVDYPYADSEYIDTMSMTRVDELTLDSDTKFGGEVTNHARRTLSEDGMEMTVIQSGKTPDGTPFSNESVYRKKL